MLRIKRETSSQASGYASLKLRLTHLLTRVKCRATSVAKKDIGWHTNPRLTYYPNVNTLSTGKRIIESLLRGSQSLSAEGTQEQVKQACWKLGTS